MLPTLLLSLQFAWTAWQSNAFCWHMLSKAPSAVGVSGQVGGEAGNIDMHPVAPPLEEPALEALLLEALLLDVPPPDPPAPEGPLDDVDNLCIRFDMNGEERLLSLTGLPRPAPRRAPRGRAARPHAPQRALAGSHHLLRAAGRLVCRGQAPLWRPPARSGRGRGAARGVSPAGRGALCLDRRPYPPSFDLCAVPGPYVEVLYLAFHAGTAEVHLTDTSYSAPPRFPSTAATLGYQARMAQKMPQMGDSSIM